MKLKALKIKILITVIFLIVNITLQAQFFTQSILSDLNQHANNFAAYAASLNSLNRPTDYGSVLGLRFWDGGGSDWRTQLAFGTDNNFYYRQSTNCSGSTWTSWYKVWHSGNLNRIDVDFNCKNLFSNGNIGVYNPNPEYGLDIIKPATLYDKLIKVRVSDASNDFFEITNATGVVNQFIPYLNGYHDSDNRGVLYISGSTSPSMDNGNNSIVVFDARYTNGPIQNRPLFSWTSYDDNKMQLNANGNLLIGKTTQTNTTYKLDVAGKIRADEIVVNTTGADFVFEPAYQLMSLNELETYLKTNRHLPGVATASEMQENGVSAGEMQTKLLQKVEELTLYVIELKKTIEDQQKQINELKNKSL